MNSEFRSACLELLRRDLTRYGAREAAPSDWPWNQKLLLHSMNISNSLRRGANPFGSRKRELGLDWPAEALTMIGMRRLESLQHCVETVLQENIPGDLVECGVWRGGASILMRAVLEIYGSDDRVVWLADSFQGVPAPDTVNFGMDRNLRLDRFRSIFEVSEQQVRANFARYGLLDGQVRFLPGWFKDTLPDAPIEQIAVLRLDGDLYESTIQSLDALYPKLSTGGFCVIDDYGGIPVCRQAVTDYRAKHHITAPIVTIDQDGALWRKED
ncbi:TylF/MycF/NovP-related O-methyltransferase [Mycolicibacterium anyangense]|uniref:TylF/MycF/NovP-related O-methyltransferase n=1 Tax=Mycolicibacterium anyangense TaxID=1431246 RepID=UPI0013D57996|nr:TylF/MycF/NovP-related O-methyltransferase [Mycolicibacterium anyangense]